MLVTPSGITMEVRLVQERKALLPIVLTLLGILIESSALHPPRAKSPIPITL